MDFLLDLADPWAYILVFLLAAGETAAFIGLFLPGEATVIFGGVIVYQGRATLGWMIASACLGAMIGDSLGYWIGRRFGTRIMESRAGRWVGRERWDKASEYLRKRGGRAVLFGRFVGFLRALVPALAGSAGVPYRTYLAFSIVGGAAWGTGFTLLGVAAGGSFRLVEKWAGRASLILGAIVVVALGMVLLARKISENRDAFKARIARFTERPRIARLRARYRKQIDFLIHRFDPRERFGLFLTFGLALMTAGAWVFGSLLQDVMAQEQLALFDRPALEFIADRREPGMNTFMRGVSFAGSTPMLLAIVTVLGGWVYLRTKQLRWPLFFAITIGGAIGLYDLIKILVERPRPDLSPLVEVGGWSFPSGHATASAAVFVAVAYVLTRQTSWKAGVVFYTMAAFAAGLIAFSRVYLGVHWPTDALGGLTLGALWTVVTVTAVKVLTAGPSGKGKGSSSETQEPATTRE